MMSAATSPLLFPDALDQAQDGFARPDTWNLLESI
jgi:hypothetical protein